MDAPVPPKSTETRWQRWLRSLLYGQDVNRNIKAKARLGLVIVAFAGIYCVIALRLVMFAAVSDGHGARRSVDPFGAVEECPPLGIDVLRALAVPGEELFDVASVDSELTNRHRIVPSCERVFGGLRH